ncbi:hypothetical protein GCM10011519_06040 [Marmoricola endophyticus]|uniref:Tetratricopeptide repeat protein n=1 Tax=Marmoricola endophyticus TaxID=2040280 RepID=A0A917BDJ3_9ACTN|nr:tetratricopeptide repeat protein [Marmoricola endophyticus]GGF35395.1 hypothetical protein GCM10011519_06040 [Marmoricola endophyticus]
MSEPRDGRRRPQQDGARRGGSGRDGGRRSGDGRERSARDPRREGGGGRTAARSESQQRYDGPEIPEEITGKELDRSVRDQLRSLPEKLALRVARHLAAAGLLIESDPKTAHQHALAARARAQRLAVVREAVGETAYAAGEYAVALSELRAAKRMNGAWDYVAIMADSERALGRPDRALDLAGRAPHDQLSKPLLAELTIVESGARRDRGELDAALRVLEQAPLQSQSRDPWVVRLRYAYADTLVAAGRRTEALEWFHRTEAIDGEEITDAGARAAQLTSDED